MRLFSLVTKAKAIADEAATQIIPDSEVSFIDLIPDDFLVGHHPRIYLNYKGGRVARLGLDMFLKGISESGIQSILEHVTDDAILDIRTGEAYYGMSFAADGDIAVHILYDPKESPGMRLNKKIMHPLIVEVHGQAGKPDDDYVDLSSLISCENQRPGKKLAAAFGILADRGIHGFGFRIYEHGREYRLGFRRMEDHGSYRAEVYMNHSSSALHPADFFNDEHWLIRSGSDVEADYRFAFGQAHTNRKLFPTLYSAISSVRIPRPGVYMTLSQHGMDIRSYTLKDTMAALVEYPRKMLGAISAHTEGKTHILNLDCSGLPHISG